MNMNPINRRDAVKLAAGLVVGTSVASAASVANSHKAGVATQIAKPKDAELASAVRNSHHYMFTEEVTVTLVRKANPGTGAR